MTSVGGILKRLPVGVQTFSEIIEGGCLYVDKTAQMYALTQLSKYTFLSRPRRFGKSLLSSTLESYFAGRKSLFEGLAVAQLEQQWKSYPVIHLDFSIVCDSNPAEVASRLARVLCEQAVLLGVEAPAADLAPGAILRHIVLSAARSTGAKVVVIIDEYDAPLLYTLSEEAGAAVVRATMREFFVAVKALDQYLKFVFITGITKFSQLSIFSELNNIVDVTMMPAFASICGFTEEEVFEGLAPYIAEFAASAAISEEEVRGQLKARFDGYHFSKVSPDIYNPFSVLYALNVKQINDYWFASGTPVFLMEQMKRFGIDILSLEGIEVPEYMFEQPAAALTSALPLLYQSGYLTIKGYDADTNTYLLQIPNGEVRTGLTRNLLPMVAADQQQAVSVQQSFVKDWKAGRYDEALQKIKEFMASIPYAEFGGMLRKESYYETLMYVLFASAEYGRCVRTQVKTARGRVDMVMETADSVAAFEFKVDGSAEEALAQICSKDYLLPLQAKGKRLVACGVNFSSSRRTIDNWIIEDKSNNN